MFSDPTIKQLLILMRIIYFLEDILFEVLLSFYDFSLDALFTMQSLLVISVCVETQKGSLSTLIHYGTLDV